MDPITRRDWIKIGAASLGVATLSPASDVAGASEYAFHHDFIIGTSLDLWIVAPSEDVAQTAERVVLDEIERLRLIFSAYDSASEVSRVNQTRGPVPVSDELFELLSVYELWQYRTHGAFGGQSGALHKIWKDAASRDEEPSVAALERITRDLHSPGWRLNSATRSVQLTNDQPLDLNALGKVYIVCKAAAAVKSRVLGVSGLLINLGGDVQAWGTPLGGAGWAVGIQDPNDHFDNAAPLAALKLVNEAVASSGGYQRFHTIRGKRYSHIIDPRSGWPAEGVASATVVSADNVTANALATSLCVLSPREGLRLVNDTPGAECLIVAADGTQFRSPGLALFAVTSLRTETIEDPKKQPADHWPEGYKMTVALELPKIEAKRYRKPYVAVWMENDAGTPVRTLGVWGNAPKYLKDLRDWWKIGKGNTNLVKAVARATRGPGKYELVWDGKDDKGNAVPQGIYTVRVEVHREFGSHLRQSGKIECLDKAATVKLEKNAETAETVVQFRKVEKK